ncbi:MAG: DegV family protein [Oscillospiraceae bacterium]|nr:DegV family protein [Oscillospiraceae bacterium]
MKEIKVTCDSTCDLTKELYTSYGVEVIPLGVSLGDDFRRDGLDVTARQIFEYVDKTGQLPKTSAISVGEYMDAFGKLVDLGYQVLHISLSGDLSSSHQNACIAAESIGGVTVIDSRSLSTGSGHLVLLAVELARSGMGAEEIAEVLNEHKHRLDVSFVLQTLDYLHKGGRCSGVAAFGANLMKLRPEIEVVDGRMQVGRKYRGNLDRSVAAYIRGRLEGRTDIQTDRIFLTHSGVPEESVAKAISLIRELQPFEEIIETTAGCTISSHCGPNCLGVLFFRKT